MIVGFNLAHGSDQGTIGCHDDYDCSSEHAGLLETDEERELKLLEESMSMAA